MRCCGVRIEDWERRTVTWIRWMERRWRRVGIEPFVAGATKGWGVPEGWRDGANGEGLMVCRVAGIGAGLESDGIG